MRVLFVASTGSIHSARWINQLKDTSWDVHVYHPGAPVGQIAEEFACGTLHVPFPATSTEGVTVQQTLPSGKLIGEARGKHPLLERVMARHHALYLAKLIERIRPDVVHSLALNVNGANLCVPVLRARRALGRRFSAPWIYSSWGSDLEYYGAVSAAHRAEVETVLASCDYYIAECERDARLAAEMGLRGEFAGFFPAFGGVDQRHLDGLRQAGPTSKRRTIFLKGRDQAGGDPIGRAMTAMRALALCEDALSDYRIVIGQASPVVATEAAVLRATTGLDIQILPRLPYDDLLRVIGASRALIALTVNDGLPSTLVEAMALGAVPLHSDLEPIAEWVTDGENGMLVPAEDPDAVAAALQRIVTDDAFVDRAVALNAQSVQRKLTDAVVRPRVLEMYERVVRQGPVVPRDQ